MWRTDLRIVLSHLFVAGAVIALVVATPFAWQALRSSPAFEERMPPVTLEVTREPTVLTP